jgi:glutathione S-transferase
MYQLYYAPGAASLVVHWLLIELDQRYELHRLDLTTGEQKRPDYLRLNPAGVVPTLIVDGQPVTECSALAMLLAERHAEHGLAPAIDSLLRPRYLQWMFHLANAVQPLLRLWWYPKEAAGDTHADAVTSQTAVRLAEAWERIDRPLADGGPYLLGDTLSTADFYLIMLMRWSRNSPRPATDWPALAAFAARMKARPSFKALYEREGLSEWA